MFARVLAAAERRKRLCRHAPSCPSCGTRQVQLVDWIALARWKCRECKTSWVFELLVRVG